MGNCTLKKKAPVLGANSKAFFCCRPKKTLAGTFKIFLNVSKGDLFIYLRQKKKGF